MKKRLPKLLTRQDLTCFPRPLLPPPNYRTTAPPPFSTIAPPVQGCSLKISAVFLRCRTMRWSGPAALSEEVGKTSGHGVHRQREASRGCQGIGMQRNGYKGRICAGKPSDMAGIASETESIRVLEGRCPRFRLSISAYTGQWTEKKSHGMARACSEKCW